MSTQAAAQDHPPAPTSGGGSVGSEFAVAPSAVIVHDPVEAGALDALPAAPERMRQEYLFRDRPDCEAYAAQHRGFVEVIGEHVDQVHYLTDLIAGEPALRQAVGNPNQVYTRDALITLPWEPDGYLPAAMAAPIRHGEPAAMAAAAQALGLRPLLALPDGLVLEGGDVIPFVREGRRGLLVGYGRRTQWATVEFLQEGLIPGVLDEIIAIELAPWRINLDGGLVPVAEDVVIAHPDSVLRSTRLDAAGREPLDLFALFADLGMRVVVVTQEESLLRQACNCLCLGDRTIVCYDMTPHAVRRLRELDVEVHAIPGTELVKGTGGPRCMSRPLYS